MASVGSRSTAAVLATMSLVLLLRTHDISIISLPLFRICENGVALAYLRESFCGLGICAVHIRVGLFGKNVELALEVCLAGVGRKFQDFVVVERRLSSLVSVGSVGERPVISCSLITPSRWIGASKGLLAGIKG